MAVSLDTERSEIHFSDKGVTIRTLLAVAAQGLAVTKQRRWKLIYSGVIIGTIQVKDNIERKSNERTKVDVSGMGTPQKPRPTNSKGDLHST